MFFLVISSLHAAALCRITFLPSHNVLVDMCMLTQSYKPVKRCIMTDITNTRVTPIFIAQLTIPMILEDLFFSLLVYPSSDICNVQKQVLSIQLIGGWLYIKPGSKAPMNEALQSDELHLNADHKHWTWQLFVKLRTIMYTVRNILHIHEVIFMERLQARQMPVSVCVCTFWR